MPPWKRLLLHAYVHGTMPRRRVRNALRSREGRSPVMVLMYHRIADDRATPWTVSNKHFEQQIAWLREHVDLVSLEEAQSRMFGPINTRPCVAITFDDGYAENCETALPLLIKERIPCTYFVATHFVRNQAPFPHDAVRGLFFPPNTLEQLRALADAGVEMGGHTRSHADLGKIDRDQQLWDELIGGSRELEEIVGRPVRYFAFPYGQYANLSRQAFALAKGAGFAGVCSAYGGYNFPGDDPFHIQRIAVDDDLIRLKNWATFDPRKLALHPRYEYEPLESPVSTRQFHRMAAATGEFDKPIAIGQSADGA